MALLSALMAVLVLMLMWFAWRRSMLGYGRDRLFRLRDEVRQHFLECGLGLDHPIYHRTRGLLNGYIRHAEHFSIGGLVYLVTRASASDLAAIKAEADQRFYTEDRALAKYVASVRLRAARALREYSVLSSSILLVLVVLTLTVATLRALRHGLRAVRDSWRPAYVGLMQATRYGHEEYYEASVSMSHHDGPMHLKAA